jgi:pentatricopeptide repeat protein
MENFDELKNKVESLTNNLIVKICEDPNFINKTREIKKDSLLIEIMHLLVKQEKYEHAAVVRDEMKHRGMDLSAIPKWVEYEKMIKKYGN